MCVPWTFDMCATRIANWCVCHDSSICVQSLMYVCCMTHWHVWRVWHASFLCAPWLIDTCVMTQWYVCHAPFIPTYDMPPGYVVHVSFMCVPWLMDKMTTCEQRLLRREIFENRFHLFMVCVDSTQWLNDRIVEWGKDSRIGWGKYEMVRNETKIKYENDMIKRDHDIQKKIYCVWVPNIYQRNIYQRNIYHIPCAFTVGMHGGVWLGMHGGVRARATVCRHSFIWAMTHPYVLWLIPTCQGSFIRAMTHSYVCVLWWERARQSPRKSKREQVL